MLDEDIQSCWFTTLIYIKKVASIISKIDEKLMAEHFEKEIKLRFLLFKYNFLDFSKAIISNNFQY